MQKNITHEEAVENCKKTIKSLQDEGCRINAISWLDETHYHINYLSREEVEAQEQAIEKALKNIKARIEARQAETELKA